LTYPDRLDEQTPAAETLRPATSKPADTPAPRATPAPKPAPTAVIVKAAPAKTALPTPAANVPAKTPAVSTVSSEPKGSGYVVQVAATKSRGEADTIARRLSGKGYPTFVTTGGANMFRVRVGKYADRHQAETIAHKLQKEEQFKPWITR
jgi:cell division septation protein DedD